MLKNKILVCITGFSLVLFVFEIAAAEPAAKGSIIPVLVPFLLDEHGGPETQTITFNPQHDNAIKKTNLDSTTENSVYQNDPLPVGCIWHYIYMPWPLDKYVQNFTCGQGLVKFNLSTIVGKTIDSATLRLSAGAVGDGVHPRQWHIFALSTTWSPSTVTWNIAQNLQHYVKSEVILDPPGYDGQSEIFEINVTNIVQNWASGTWNNWGLIFGSHDYTFPNDTSSDMFMFYSLEYPEQVRPKLIVTFH